ncbi:Nif11-like leader peptide family natural product precursor [Solidesulfovibrio sp.]|uniref:Nif11-like leader peptide family natural product precursor n=1 Tax=Solidesulfovibrio sp. TaxID=2910990 RepID=UPI002B205ABA|nr:Nif11-like leader peptide family natural product precursor [Solidesulfovibrio sp.]MEA4855475.1 Nif11-like leader peptide family natural product precursor [Solidesulfovibrio sp.]
MSQDAIDRFLEYLRADKDRLLLVGGMPLGELVAYAASLGFVFTAEELKARQALVHLVEGT